MEKRNTGLLGINMMAQTRIAGLALLITLAAWVVPCANAQDLTAPTRVVNGYLDSLVTGDTQTLALLIDGRMKQNNRQLVLSPDSYSQFLKTNYAGVQTTIEEIVPDGTRVRAKVRFDYPSQDSSLVEFILTESNGSWKISDEVY